MSGRTTTILERFPAHLQPADPGKLFVGVVDALARELDVKSSQLGRTRRAHALGDADEPVDLRLLAALHGLRDDDFALLRLRLAALTPELPYAAQLELLRRTIRTAIDLHRDGNATVATLLGAAAAGLGLELGPIETTDDRYWHLAACTDLLPDGGEERAADLLALEENPFQPKELDPVERRHGDVFRITRSGLETVIVTVRVVGKGSSTVHPVVVNLDDGFGLVYAGEVPDGVELRFESDGRVLLGGTDVSRSSFAFRGGLFASGAATHPNDFRFAPAGEAGRDAVFATTEPVEDAFAPATVFPHAEGLLDAAGMAVGESRWAFFVRAAHYGRAAEQPADALAVPVLDAAVFDESVFAPGTAASGAVGFAWQEREPFAATVWLPQRFSDLDEDGELPVRERVRLFLDRYRAAGVHLYTRYADDRWTLGAGVVRPADSTEPRGTVLVGTRLWPPDAPDT